jgi:probable phosphoglycerate mutase
MSRQDRVKPRRLIIMRHGQTDWNAEWRFQGRTDIPLNEVGLEQARAAAPAVAALKPTRIVASPLQRALVTAQTVAEHLGLDVEQHDGFIETDLGVWEGMVEADVRHGYPSDIRAWRAGIPGQRAGVTGESKLDLAERTMTAVQGIMHDADPGSVTLVVMHGGASRALIGALMGLRPEDWNTYLSLGNCAWSVLEEDIPGTEFGQLAFEGEAGASDNADYTWRLLKHNVDAC